MGKLIIYTGVFAEPENNAAGKRVYGNSLILESIGYDVLMIGKTQDDNYSGKKYYSEHISFESYPKYGRIKYKAYVDFLGEVVKKQKEKPSYIIRYGSPSLSIYDIKMLQLAHSMDIKVIVDVVDWLSPNGQNIFFNIIKAFDTYLEKAVYNNLSDGIIAISTYLGEYYERKVRNVVVIPPIVPEFKFNSARNEKISIIYAGIPFRIGHKVKDVHKIKDRLDLTVVLLAELHNRGVKNFIFRIFGITKEEYLVAFPEHRGILKKTDEFILFCGRKPMGEIQEQLRKSDFSILLREITKGTTAGFPTKIVESMSCGTPVITTKTSDLESYIEDGVNGFFVEIKEKENLISQFLRIFTIDHEVLKKMKVNCYKSKQFTPEIYKAKLEMFLDKMNTI